MPAPPPTSRDGEYFEALESLFNDSVKLCMRSDVPVGAYLSAGVDSSLTVAAMTKFSSNINTYSVGFDSPVDETPAARETAKFLGTNHHEIICQPEDFDLLPKIVWHMDRPVGDALLIAFYKLAQGAAKDLKVVLGGEGADEAFAGYSFQGVITQGGEDAPHVPRHPAARRAGVSDDPARAAEQVLRLPRRSRQPGKEARRRFPPPLQRAAT